MDRCACFSRMMELTHMFLQKLGSSLWCYKLFQFFLVVEAFSIRLSSQFTIVTSQPGQGLVRQLEMGLKDADLVPLKQLLVVQICRVGDWGQDSPSPEAQNIETEGRKLYCNIE